MKSINFDRLRRWVLLSDPVRLGSLKNAVAKKSVELGSDWLIDKRLKSPDSGLPQAFESLAAEDMHNPGGGDVNAILAWVESIEWPVKGDKRNVAEAKIDHLRTFASLTITLSARLNEPL